MTGAPRSRPAFATTRWSLIRSTADADRRAAGEVKGEVNHIRTTEPQPGARPTSPTLDQRIEAFRRLSESPRASRYAVFSFIGFLILLLLIQAMLS